MSPKRFRGDGARDESTRCACTKTTTARVRVRVWERPPRRRGKTHLRKRFHSFLQRREMGRFAIRVWKERRDKSHRRSKRRRNELFSRSARNQIAFGSLVSAPCASEPIIVGGLSSQGPTRKRAPRRPRARGDRRAATARALAPARLRPARRAETRGGVVATVERGADATARRRRRCRRARRVSARRRPRRGSVSPRRRDVDGVDARGREGDARRTSSRQRSTPVRTDASASRMIGRGHDRSPPGRDEPRRRRRSTRSATRTATTNRSPAPPPRKARRTKGRQRSSGAARPVPKNAHTRLFATARRIKVERQTTGPRRETPQQLRAELPGQAEDDVSNRVSKSRPSAQGRPCRPEARASKTRSTCRSGAPLPVAGARRSRPPSRRTRYWACGHARGISRRAAARTALALARRGG